MKLLIVCTLSIVAAVAANQCNSVKCDVRKNCRCSNAVNPLGKDLKEYPQLISLTFDEAVTVNLVENVWKPLLFDKINPDHQPIGGTFFVPHEYSDYEKVNELYNSGFEIGVHSITKNNLQSYWRNANESVLEEEFKGQKIILNKFANIPKEHIRGVRTPQLQLAGDATFEAYVKAELDYDSSWPTLPIYPMFPYTLDYPTTQMCHLGAKCPKSSFQGFWVLPIIDLRGDNKECNTLATCNINGTSEEIVDWLMGEIDHIRTTSRAPITLLVNSYWFNFTENSYHAMELLFEKSAENKDIFFVSQSDVIDWVKNPIKLANYKSPAPERNAKCKPRLCSFNNHKYNMNSCTPCPEVYPWLGNPEGKKD